MNNLVKRELDQWRRAPSGSRWSKSVHAKPSGASTYGKAPATTPWTSAGGMRWPADFPSTVPSWWSPAWSNAVTTDLAAPFTSDMEEAIMNTSPATTRWWSDANAFPMSSMLNFEWPAQLTTTSVNEKGDLVMKTKLPAGMEQDDIHLDFEEGGLRLTATKSHEETRDAPNNSGHTRHSSYVSVGHYWPLDEGVTQQDVEANFHRDEGVLEIVVNLPHKMDVPSHSKPKTMPITIGGASTPHRSIASTHPHSHSHHNNGHQQHQQHHSHQHAEQLAADHHAKTARDISASSKAASASSAGNMASAGSMSSETSDRLQPATGDMLKPTSNLIDSMNAASSLGPKERANIGKTTESTPQKAGEKVNINATTAKPASTKSSTIKPSIGPDAPQVPSLDEM